MLHAIVYRHGADEPFVHVTTSLMGERTDEAQQTIANALVSVMVPEYRRCIGCNRVGSDDTNICFGGLAANDTTGEVTHYVFNYAFYCAGEAACAETASRRLASTRRTMRDESSRYKGEDCHACGQLVPQGLKRCGQCRFVGYCSQACCAADWPRHKVECVGRK